MYPPSAATNFWKLSVTPRSPWWLATGWSRPSPWDRCTKAQLRAEGLLEDAVRRGANVTSLGRVGNEATFSGGYFMRPILVTDIPEDAPLMAEEQFCPAIPVAAY